MDNRPLTHFGDMSIEHFLAEYWQKKPLFIKGGITPPTLEADVLAGYALEKSVESRIICEKPTANDPLNSQWTAKDGPFKKNAFSKLPNSHWTLLVQSVNALNLDIHNLLQQFRIVPNWRLDDVMVSYATPGGGVGPHFDYYDVFLIQASGNRRWTLGPYCDHKTPLRQDAPNKILTEFNVKETFYAEPGDILYIPPRLAHWGIAENECMTYSIGFRAPALSEILLEFSQEAASHLTHDDRFSDPNRMPCINSGLIPQSDILQVQALLQTFISNPDNVGDWFARYMTQPKRALPDLDLDSKDLKLSLRHRAAYRLTDSQELAHLYINGDLWQCTETLAKTLCAHENINLKDMIESDTQVVLELYDLGYLTGIRPKMVKR